MANKKEPKEKSNSVKLTDSNILKEAKIVSIKRNYESLGEYITQAVKEKNQREK
jgi:hypothetical protein